MSVALLVVQLLLIVVLVFEVSDPDSLNKAALREKHHLDKQATKEGAASTSHGVTSSAGGCLSDEEFVGRFIKRFIELEGDLNQLYRKENPKHQGHVSVVQSANCLRQLGILPEKVYKSLRNINRYRNAMVHSGDYSVNPLILEELDKVADAINGIARGQAGI